MSMIETDTDSAIKNMERIARIAKATESAARRIQRSKIRLVMGREAKAVFFASVICKLKVVFETKNNPTACTDGKRVIWNPEFVDKLSDDQLLGVSAHEVMHVTNAHHARMGNRNPRLWNVAADLAINDLLLGADFKLPPGVCIPGEGEFADYDKGLSAEAYYAKLERNKYEPPQGKDPFGCGYVILPGDGSPAACAAAEIQSRVMAAAAREASRGRGQLPDGLGRAVDEVLNPKADWVAVLRRFVSSIAKNDWSWRKLNRRAWVNGMTLPGMYSEQLGDIILAIDDSGSIGQDTLNKFGAEAQGILDSYDCSLTIVYCDAAVHKVDQWKSTDGDLKLDSGANGGGGTSHRPVWEWLEEQIATYGAQPKCVIALTDMATDFGEDPGIPVLWASVGAGPEPEAPFGEVVVVEE